MSQQNLRFRPEHLRVIADGLGDTTEGRAGEGIAWERSGYSDL